MAARSGESRGGGVYSLSARLMPGDTIHYAFFSGPNRAEDQETLDQACANEEGARTCVVPASGGYIIHTFGQCNAGTLPAAR